jgi:hypothetical protein
MTDDSFEKPESSNDSSFRDKINEFLQLCSALREEALANGLDKNQFNSLLASILQEEEQEKALRSALHTARVEEFLDTCRSLREKAMAKGLTRDRLDIELIAALMDNQTLFDSLKEKKEEEKHQSMLQNILGKIGGKPGNSPGR